MTSLPLLLFSIVILVQPTFSSQAPNGDDAQMQIGSIDYFGYAGLDLKQVENHLPIHVGDWVSFNSFDRKKKAIQRFVKQFTGKPATDIAIVCCDGANHLLIYIGLDGASSRSLAHNPPPRGQDRLEETALKLYARDMAAIEDAVRRGASSEDDSKGYSLSADPRARQVELEIRAFAAGRGEEIERVLHNSSDVQQRRASACLLGYADRSTAQIQGLVRATGDVDDDVRNNAMRALSVLASANDAAGIDTDPSPFITMLYSGQWTDRNKSSLLLFRLTHKRDPILLMKLREQALEPLIEGARWSDPGHSFGFLVILGRIEGIPEAQLLQMVTKGDSAGIIQTAERALRESSH
jgi:hypothetical protein